MTKYVRYYVLITNLVLSFLFGVVHAEENKTEASLRAYAAGYKAGFTCSATFNAGKSLGDIHQDELTGIEKALADIADELPAAEIDQANKHVSVIYSDNVPPRIAQWRPRFGCVHLPIGVKSGVVELLPYVRKLPLRDTSIDNGAPWTKRAAVNAASNNERLEQVIASAFTQGPYGDAARTSAILIATNDEIIAERYADGLGPTTSQRTWSVAKSLTSTVMGAAVGEGLMDLKAPANIPEWRNAADPRRQIILENLLHMSSGLDSDANGGIPMGLYFGGALVTDVSTETALEAMPGTRFKYASNDTLLAIRALRATLNDDSAYHRFPFEAVLDRIGMSHTFLETDWEGNFVLSSQVWATARDLARLGLLHLQNGVWKGERVLPEGWVEYVTTPAPAQPPRREDGAPSLGYGAQWWLFNGFPGLPDGSYAALGHRGQAVMVIPAEGLVIVRRGYDLAGGQGFQIADFAADVVAAMTELSATDRNPEDASYKYYFGDADPDSPLVTPINSEQVLARFPPSLLLTSTRDGSLSGVVFTHSQLTRLGVEANLHVWEGLGHGFFYDPDIPESREVYDVVVNFFDKYLGQ